MQFQEASVKHAWTPQQLHLLVTGVEESNEASAPISRFRRHSPPPQALRHSTSDGSSKTIFEQTGSKFEAMFRRFIVSLILDVAGR